MSVGSLLPPELEEKPKDLTLDGRKMGQFLDELGAEVAGLDFTKKKFTPDGIAKLAEYLMTLSSQLAARYLWYSVLYK